MLHLHLFYPQLSGNELRQQQVAGTGQFDHSLPMLLSASHRCDTEQPTDVFAFKRLDFYPDALSRAAVDTGHPVVSCRLRTG